MTQGRILRAGREVILPHIHRTETMGERLRGLLGREPPVEGQGLLITPCNAIHTFFMSIPLDVIFLDRNHVIVAMRNELGPWRLAMSPAASSVLELMAGQIGLSGLQAGESLVWEST